MDIEQLKLITEAIGQLGADGKEAFIWYIVASSVAPLVATIIGWAGGITLVVLGIRCVKRIVSALCASDALGEAAGANWDTSGEIPYWNQRELKRVCEHLENTSPLRAKRKQ